MDGLIVNIQLDVIQVLNELRY